MIIISRKKTDFDWWQDRIKTLKGKSEEVHEIVEKFSLQIDEIDDTKGFGEWTFLKLLTLAYYIDVYSNIAKIYFDKIFYIDICAGEGLVKLRRINEIIAGSSLLGQIVPREEKRFDKLYLVENDSDKSKMLKEILPDAEVYCADANNPGLLDTIEEVLQNGNNNHYLAFIDPYTTDINWKTIERLMENKGDLIINYMFSPIARIWGSYHSQNVNKKERMAKKLILDDFFGDEGWLTILPKDSGGTGDDLLNFYITKIKKYRDIVIPIAIRGLKGRFTYYMLVAIRDTKGAQGWIKAVHKVKEYVEKADDKFINQLFLIYNRKQKTMNGYFS